MLNKVMLIGRLGKDPEMKYTQGGTPICHFSIATDEQWKNKEGEKQKRTTWHNIIAWNKLAEICGEYLEKGKLVYIEGKIQIREWEKDDKKGKAFEIVADQMTMLSGGENKAKRPSPSTAGSSDDQISDEDIPF